MSNRRQTTIWTNADPICIYAALGGDELIRSKCGKIYNLSQQTLSSLWLYYSVDILRIRRWILYIHMLIITTLFMTTQQLTHWVMYVRSNLGQTTSRCNQYDVIPTGGAGSVFWHVCHYKRHLYVYLPRRKPFKFINQCFNILIPPT